jgi:DNA-binding LacI/PurR family transcriptional regulator/catechol 2,3-dioxygenase-like lactoylglutathione lyase family enzyme
VTIKDIARDLGLSTATVSLALNDAPGVNRATRERVRAHALAVGYRVDASARAIITGHTFLLGVIIGRVTESFYEEIVQGMEDVATHAGYDLIVSTVGSGSRPETDLVERLIGRRIEGVIATPYSLTETGVARFKAVGIPVLMLRPDAGGDLPYVAVDNRLGGEIALRYLLELGHRRVLYVGAVDRYSDLRYEGAMQVAEAAGASIEKCSVPAALDREGARTAVRQRLRSERDFTAIFAADDMLAIGAYEALREAELSVPEHVSVIGYDDLLASRLFERGLTTIRQPQGLLGEIAMQMLIDLVSERPVENRLVAPELRERASTGRAPDAGQAIPRRHIGYVTVVVRNYDEAIAYYTGVLGFDLLEDTALENGKRWVLVAPNGGSGTALLLARATTPEQESRTGNQTGGRVFLFLHTSGFRHDYALLAGRGVRFEGSPREEPYGTVAVFTDLYGNRWDLLELGSQRFRLS